MGFPLLTRMHLREKREAFLARKMSVGMVRIIVVSGEYRLFADLATCYVNAIKRYAIEGKRCRRAGRDGRAAMGGEGLHRGDADKKIPFVGMPTRNGR